MNLSHFLGFGGNALISAICAYQLLFNTDYYVQAVGFNESLLSGLGAGLVLFCFLLTYNLFKPTLAQGIVITALDISWILGTTIITIVMQEQFTEMGMYILVLVNCGILLAIVFQYASLFSLLKYRGTEFKHYLEITRPLSCSPNQFWSVLSELDEIHKYSSSVDTSTVDSKANNLGTTRYCTSGDTKKWSETVYEWKVNEAISFKFNTDAEGFPFPVEKMNGGWKLAPSGHDVSVTVWFAFNFKGPGLMVPVFCYLWTLGMTAAIKNMGKEACTR